MILIFSMLELIDLLMEKGQDEGSRGSDLY